jgi:hypothetical protein
MQSQGTKLERLLTMLAYATLFFMTTSVAFAQARIERIAFETNRDSSSSLEIYLMKTDGTGLVRLTNNTAQDINPVISPDGRRIAFSSDRDGNYEIYIMNVDGTNPIRLTNHPAQDTTPTWNADGSKIAFSSLRDGNFEIYVINADGSNATNITNTPSANETTPSYSRDGFKVTYLRDSQVWVMNASGSNPLQLTNETAPLTLNPTFNHDGTKIAFRKLKDVHVMNVDGSNQVNLTNSNTLDNEPSYSPDGSKIAFKSYRNSNYEIYTMNADGSNQRRLTNTTSAVSDSEPDWGSISGVGVDLPDLSAVPNTEVTVPVTVSNTTGYGILSYDFTLSYNAEVLEPLPMPYDTASTLSTNFEVNTAGSPGQLRVSGFGTAPLAGNGTLVNLKFKVIGQPQTSTSLMIAPVVFNEGNPFAIASTGKVQVTGMMKGAVRYATSAATPPVPGVSILAAGSPNVSGTTGDDGTYDLQGFGLGAYTAVASKQGDATGITAFDATLVSKFVIGAASLTAPQQIAADVSASGGISSYDAALIAQYVVGLSSGGSTGIWRFTPETRSYTSVVNETGQDYSAILIGEVSGNWTHQANSLTGQTTQTGRRPAAVSVSLPSLRAAQNQIITIPVTLGLPASAGAFEGYQFDLVYDPQVVRPDAVSVDTSGTLSTGLSVVVNNAQAGRMRLAVYGASAINSSGTLINLKFRVVGKAGAESLLSFAGLMFNEGTPAVEGKDGRVTVRR